MLDLTNRENIFYWQTDRNLTAKDYARIFLKRHKLEDEEIITVLKNGFDEFKEKSIEIEQADENFTKGNVNIVRKVFVDSKSYVVRMHPKGVKNGYFYVEREALRQAAQSKVPVPEVVHIHEAADANDMDFMVMTVSPGITMDVYLQKEKSNEPELLFDAGRIMGLIHGVRVDGYGAFDNALAKNKSVLKGLHSRYADFIHTGLEENLSRLIRFEIINKDQAGLMRKVFKYYNFEPTRKPRLIHNDFADWNLLTDGTKLTAVLDWDECHAGDQVADLACWSTFFNIERMNRFMDGYQSVAELPADYDERFHFYRLRYVISKMALRIKRHQVDKSPFILEKLEVGKVALSDELEWFKTH